MLGVTIIDTAFSKDQDAALLVGQKGGIKSADAASHYDIIITGSYW